MATEAAVPIQPPTVIVRNCRCELRFESKLKTKRLRRLAEGGIALRVAAAPARWPHSWTGRARAPSRTPSTTPVKSASAPAPADKRAPSCQRTTTAAAIAASRARSFAYIDHLGSPRRDTPGGLGEE